MNVRTLIILFVIFIGFPIVGILINAQESAQDKYTASEIVILKKIASHSIKKALETTKDIDEAASLMGIEAGELRQLCLALNIDIGVKTPELEPVPIQKPVSTPSKEKFARDDLSPDVILNYSGSSPYVLLVEKSFHTLYLLKYENGKRTVIDSFDCKTGKNHGDKIVSGDERTPEGIYFLINKYSRKEIQEIVGKENVYKYGEMAFVTNFPNALDLKKGKNGGGIWLHGTDAQFDDSSSNDTRGCVVTTNETIKQLSRFIVPGRTPIIIVNALNFMNGEEVKKQGQMALKIIEDWKTSWENKNIVDYIEHYSPSFTSQGMNRAQWKQDKQGKFERNNNYRIILKDIIILSHNESIVAHFIQQFSINNTNFATVGTKTLYLVPEQNTWKIVSEQFR